MQKRSIVIATIIALLLGCLHSQKAQCQFNAFEKLYRNYQQSFVNIKSDPKALGLGGAYLAAGNDVSSLFWNPAILPHIESFQSSLFYGKHEESIRWWAGSAGLKNFGIGLIGMTDSNLPLPSLTQSINSQKPVNWGGIGRFAGGFKLLNLFSLGVSVKPTYFEWQDVETQQDTIKERIFGYSSDIGIFKKFKNFLGVGIVAQDVFNTMKYEKLAKDTTESEWMAEGYREMDGEVFGLPVRFRAGAVLYLGDRLNFSMDVDRLENNPVYHFGSKINLTPLPLHLWIGVFGDKNEIKHRRELNWSTGIGVKIFGQELNYAYLDEPGFSASHMIGTSFDLGRRPKTMQTEDDNLTPYIRDKVNDLVRGNDNQSLKSWNILNKANRNKMEQVLNQIYSEDNNFSNGINNEFVKPTGFTNNVLLLAISNYDARYQLLRRYQTNINTGGNNLPSRQDSNIEEPTTQTFRNSNTSTGSTEIPVEQPPFLENFYTYKSLYNSANDFELMANEAQVKFAETQEDKIWGLREAPEPWNAPGVLMNKEWLMHWAFWGNQSSSIRRVLLDMNGDDLPDYLVSDPEDDNNQWAKQKMGWSIYFNTGSSFGMDTVWAWSSSLIELLGNDIHGIAWALGDATTTRTFDMNNDNLPDYVLSRDINGNKWNSNVWKIALNGWPETKGFSGVINWQVPSGIERISGWEKEYYGSDTNNWIYYLKYETFDITGDSIPDHVVYKTDSNGWYWEVYEGYYNSRNNCGFKSPLRWNFEGINDDDLFVTYFNNYNWSGSICNIDGRTNDAEIVEITIEMTGDNLPDHVFSTTTGIWYVAKNNGSGFDKPKRWSNSPFGKYTGQRTKRSTLFMNQFPQDYTISRVVKNELRDINNDGMADFIDASVGGDGWTVWINNGSGFDPPQIFNTDPKFKTLHGSHTHHKAGGYVGCRKYRWLLDMNADGCPDLIDALGADNSQVWNVYINTTGGDEKLANLSDQIKIREIQTKLQQGHEAYFHEEYVLALKAYENANKLIYKHIGEPSAGEPEESSEPGTGRDFREMVNSARRLGRTISGIEPIVPLPGLNNAPQSSTIGLNPNKPISSFKLPVTTSGKILDIYTPYAEINIEEEIYNQRIDEAVLDKIILNKEICDSTQSFALYLIHIRDFILPLCLADIYLEMGNYEFAEEFYTQAVEYAYLNVPIEMRVLWLKFARLYLRWGNELFKKSYRANDEFTIRNSSESNYKRITGQNLPIFTSNSSSSDPQNLGRKEFLSQMKVMTTALIGGEGMIRSSIRNISIPFSEIITRTSLQIARQELSDLSLNNTSAQSVFESTNPLMIVLETEALLNIAKLNNGLNYLGYDKNVLPIWRYSYLLGLSRNFAQHAIQLEREYVNFKVNAENETYTQKQLIQSIGLNKFNQLIEEHKVEHASWQTAISKINERMAYLKREAARKAYNELKNQNNTLSIINDVVTIGFQTYMAVQTGGLAGLASGPVIAENIQDMAGSYGQKASSAEQAKLQYEQAKLAHQASEMQIIVAQINQQIGILQRDIAKLQLVYAQENLSYIQNKEFNAEMWFKLSEAVRDLSNNYLDAAVELALLMEKAYNFETGRGIHKIRLDYNRNDLSGLLAGDYLLRDIESFEYDRYVNIIEKEVPIKHVISLASSRPLQFFRFLNTDTLSFATNLNELAIAHPGAYNCRIKNVELVIEGLLPPGGISGTLSNGCYSMVRQPMPSVVDRKLLKLFSKYNVNSINQLPDSVKWRFHGAYYDTLKIHEMETMVLSKYAIREDRLVFTPPPEQLGIFENTGVATAWTLHIPRHSNNFNLHTITDVKFVITFTAQHDYQLASLVTKDYLDYRNNNESNFTALRTFSARYNFPDEFYQFINSEDTEDENVLLHFPLKKYYFPVNENSFKVADVSLVFFPPDSIPPDSLLPASLFWKAKGQDLYDNLSYTTQNEKGILTFEDGYFSNSNNNPPDPDFRTPIADWVIKIPKSKFINLKLSHIHDIWLCINYSSKVRAPGY